MFDLKEEREIGHIQLSRQADLVVVAPATANILAKMANGIADDLATTLLLATDKPVLAVPAMNVRMWHHAATQRNLARLHADGVHLMEPDSGEMACGEFGKGRLPEPEAIVEEIERLLEHPAAKDPLAGQPDFEGAELPLKGRHILVTAGPTHEPIDPVRYIANRSSGKQGFAIAAAAARAGARVTLVAGRCIWRRLRAWIGSMWKPRGRCWRRSRARCPPMWRSWWRRLLTGERRMLANRS